MAETIRSYASVDFGEGLRLCPTQGIVYQADTSRSIDYGQNYWQNYERYENSPISDQLNQFRTSLAEKYCSCVLDIGIGCGTFLKRLSIKGFGYDINPIAVDWLKGRGLYRNPYEGLPEEVDGVTLWDVIEHMPDPDRLLTLVNPGTFVITSLPVFEDVSEVRSSKHFKPDEHYYYFTSPGLVRYMHDIGYQMVDALNTESTIGRQGIMTFVFEKLS